MAHFRSCFNREHIPRKRPLQLVLAEGFHQVALQITPHRDWMFLKCVVNPNIFRFSLELLSPINMYGSFNAKISRTFRVSPAAKSAFTVAGGEPEQAYFFCLVLFSPPPTICCCCTTSSHPRPTIKSTAKLGITTHLVAAAEPSSWRVYSPTETGPNQARFLLNTHTHKTTFEYDDITDTHTHTNPHNT